MPVKETEVNDAQVVFWALPKRHQLDNFIKEQRTQTDRLITPAKCIEFANHIFVTSEKKEIDFIRKSGSFNVTIWECPNLKDAIKRTEEYEKTRGHGIIKDSIGVNEIKPVNFPSEGKEH